MIRFQADGEDGLRQAIRLGQQSFASRYQVRVQNIRLSGQELTRFVSGTIDDGSFPLSQLHSYEVRGKASWTGAGEVEVANQFLCTPQQANGALSLAAETALQLRPRLGRSPDTRTVIRVFQQYVNGHFSYRDGGPHSHQMGTLFREGGGVCQAIASLAVAVMGFLGIGCCYVKGEGWDGHCWASHAWNLFEDGTMADFTFGLNGATPHTLTRLSTRNFCQNHRWPDAQRQYRPFSPSVCLPQNSRTLRAGLVLVTTDRPMLDRRGLDLTGLPLFGGCAEYRPEQDAIRLALPGGGRQWLLPQASRQLRERRYMPPDALPWRLGPKGELRF